MIQGRWGSKLVGRWKKTLRPRLEAWRVDKVLQRGEKHVQVMCISRYIQVRTQVSISEGWNVRFVVEWDFKLHFERFMVRQVRRGLITSWDHPMQALYQQTSSKKCTWRDCSPGLTDEMQIENGRSDQTLYRLNMNVVRLAIPCNDYVMCFPEILHSICNTVRMRCVTIGQKQSSPRNPTFHFGRSWGKIWRVHDFDHREKVYVTIQLQYNSKYDEAAMWGTYESIRWQWRPEDDGRIWEIGCSRMTILLRTRLS